MKPSQLVLLGVLKNKKRIILENWFEKIVAAYPPETRVVLKRVGEQFANPVGSVLYRGIEGLLQSLVDGGELVDMMPFIDEIIKIKAVYDSSPSRAVDYAFQLRQVIWDQALDEINDGTVAVAELVKLDIIIDNLTLASFEKYMKFQEQIYEVRATELRRRYHMLDRLASVGK